ncbi:hypothetical protein [Calycomorphotria hydatis]|uniref:Ion transport protein n=1 Tax=Calycomorphotria hydatis TaxID=2528027 RepID=A0A517TAF8_9PLAN|nr:hypothetical protein [Calycomorphotria hydatis]QDT65354.1 hypothetical protein V22_26030 [Calycomorphotria hydatis]
MNFHRVREELLWRASLVWLILLGGLLHIWESMPEAAIVCLGGILLIWPVFWAEAIISFAKGDRRYVMRLISALLPPLRMMLRDKDEPTKLFFPGRGLVEVNDNFREQLESQLQWPMVGIALLVLPVTGFEYVFASKVADSHTLQAVFALTTGFIWFAFALEFLVMISVAPKKLIYCKDHWLDLAIILLPLIAFLRAARLGRLLRLQQVAKAGRMYRLKGLIFRLQRAAIVLNLVERILRPTPEKQLAHLQKQYAAKEEELQQLSSRIENLEAQLHSQQQNLPLPEASIAA